MKIGIMSMQRIKNYGSFLQAYSLKNILEEIGYKDVQFIDYKIGKPLVENKKRSIIKRGINKIKRIVLPSEKEKENIIKIFNKRYDNEFLPLLGIKEERNYNYKVDCLIIGSDEVFNCIQSNPDVGYSKELFGQNFDKSNVISYAGCFGSVNYERLKRYGIDKEISELLNKFKNISVRDNNSLETVKQLTQKESNINLDPVLIYNFNNLINNNVVKYKDYIIVYAYTDRINKEEGKRIKEFAKKYNKKIISIGTFQECADIHLVLNPFEMLAYIKNASYIVTDTFHGSIFSIKFNKKFITIIRKTNKEKLGDLLKRLQLEERQVKDIEDIEKTLIKDINYKKTNNIIEQEKEKTIKYLKDSIK